MSGPTILVYLHDERTAKQLIDAARDIAGRRGGRVIGIYAGAQFVVLPMAGIHLPSVAHEEWFRREDEKGADLERIFLAATDGDPFDIEWRYLRSGGYPVAEVVMPLARCCDMIVAGLPEGKAGDGPFAGVVETLAMESGRPILMVPAAIQNRGDLLEQVMVAWDGSRESARATFDALPLLADAEDVQVVCVEEASDRRTVGDLPTGDIATTLAHAGVTCIADQVERKGRTIGEALIARADETGATMLVMGIYGHSKWREVVFGGATRHVLAHARFPVFVSR